jgi:hypothetical protein
MTIETGLGKGAEPECFCLAAEKADVQAAQVNAFVNLGRKGNVRPARRGRSALTTAAACAAAGSSLLAGGRPCANRRGLDRDRKDLDRLCVVQPQPSR